MFTLHPMTGGFRDGMHQVYPTPEIEPRPVESEDAAEEAAVRLFSAYGSISYLTLTDRNGEHVKDYRRGHFFQAKSPLRDARLRVATQEPPR
ncbi:hypothetical protein G6W57_00855 [Streptomyces sp. CAI-121]|uniref:hypothetical protein n=1 Tax=unclassified Streptomyces TaxID=2593676 RepID=UPI001587B648|nr:MULTISPECIES: hypothetical protein [unclassified Streptomyces]NUV65664.1 hypothetical protein [Streptomyces sp. CAI-121]NUW12401.1 hypothetical protein [Streptomyces sp. CAI-68]